MQLWTWHSPTFSLLEGRVDPTKSSYAKTVPKYLSVREELCRRLGTDDQIVWCSTKADHTLTTIEEAEWVLEVPDAAILALMNDWVWNLILGLKPFPPKHLSDQWHDEGIDLFPYDQIARQRFLDEQYEKFQAGLAPNGDPWSNLFVRTPAGDGITAIIRHPIKPEWVKSRLARRKLY
jgi:hypothetical protein